MKPVTTSMSVVLPAPFGPISPTTSPGWTSSDASRHGDDPAELHVDVADAQRDRCDRFALDGRERRRGSLRPLHDAPDPREQAPRVALELGDDAVGEQDQVQDQEDAGRKDDVEIVGTDELA